MKKSTKHKKSILLVQFRTGADFVHERMCYYTKVLQHAGVSLTIVNALDTKQDWKHPQKMLQNYDGLILGGSGEIHFSHLGAVHKKMLQNVKPLIAHVLRRDFPTLGVCLGHQILGHEMGSKIVHDPKQMKTGSHLVHLLEAALHDPLYRGIPKQFLAQYAHKEVVEKLPKDATLLAQGKKCAVAAFRYKRHVYGVQFHPELSVSDMFFRLRLATEYIPEDKKGSIGELFCATERAQKILVNFIEKVAVSSKVEDAKIV